MTIKILISMLAINSVGGNVFTPDHQSTSVQINEGGVTRNHTAAKEFVLEQRLADVIAGQSFSDCF
jgi:hypothetical protein